MNIRTEFEEHEDLVIGNFNDTYDNLPAKTFFGYQLINDKCKNAAKYVTFAGFFVR